MGYALNLPCNSSGTIWLVPAAAVNCSTDASCASSSSCTTGVQEHQSEAVLLKDGWAVLEPTSQCSVTSCSGGVHNVVAGGQGQVAVNQITLCVLGKEMSQPTHLWCVIDSELHQLLHAGGQLLVC